MTDPVEPQLCGECETLHRPGENTLCPGWRPARTVLDNQPRVTKAAPGALPSVQRWVRRAHAAEAMVAAVREIVVYRDDHADDWSMDRVEEAVRIQTEGVPRPQRRAAVTPRALLESEGFELVLDPDFLRRPDVVGDPACCTHAILLTDFRIAAAEESWDLVYGATHEIAHAHALQGNRGWVHDDNLWGDQATILSKWLRRLGFEHDRAFKGPT